MGYLKINTTNTGEVVVDASRVLYVKKTGQAIDLVTQIGDPASVKTEIRISGSNITEETKKKFNQAVIDAQGTQFVHVVSRDGEEFESVSLDPA